MGSQKMLAEPPSAASAITAFKVASAGWPPCSRRSYSRRDLTDAPEAEVAAERARVATEGWGAELVSPIRA